MSDIRAMINFTQVAELDSLPPNQSRVVEFNDRMVALYCPFHGWDFDLKTGTCSVNPERPVTIYPVKILDGKIHLAEPSQ